MAETPPVDEEPPDPPAPEFLPAPLVIVGPTASGKSSLALSLARSVPGCELVSADAMAVYRGMDIGTAKPSAAERAEVRHHLVDVVDPSQDFTVARFADEVTQVLDYLDNRGRRAVVVGGTGLYVRSVVDSFAVPPRFPNLRAELEADPDLGGLYGQLQELDPVAATKMEASNRRRIVRALEVCLGTGKPFSSFGPGVDHYGPTRFRLVGLEIDREVMDARIERRYRRQLEDGFLDEVRRLLDGPGLGPTAAQALGYRELAAHLRGETTLDEALDEAIRRTRKFARRQQRWFRRDPRIRWFPADADDLAERVRSWWLDPSPLEPGSPPPPKSGADVV